MSICPSRTENRRREPTTSIVNSAERTGQWLTRLDEELVLEYSKNGNRDIFEELVRRFHREIYSYLRGRIGDAHLAEDALQTTFLQVHLQCRQFAPGRITPVALRDRQPSGDRPVAAESAAQGNQPRCPDGRHRLGSRGRTLRSAF